MSSRFIFEDYGPALFLWEIYALMRKLAMSGALVFFNKGSPEQLSLDIFGFVALIGHTRLFPNKHDWLQMGVHIAVC